MYGSTSPSGGRNKPQGASLTQVAFYLQARRAVSGREGGGVVFGEPIEPCSRRPETQPARSSNRTASQYVDYFFLFMKALQAKLTRSYMASYMLSVSPTCCLGALEMQSTLGMCHCQFDKVSRLVYIYIYIVANCVEHDLCRRMLFHLPGRCEGGSRLSSMTRNAQWNR